MQNAIRMILLASMGIAIGGGGVCVLAAAAAKQDCDRQCLRGFMTKYLEAMVAHAPETLPVAKKVRFTEDGMDTQLGQGLWKSITKLGTYRQDILDADKRIAGAHVVVEEEDGKPALLVVRLKVSNDKIEEIETQVTRMSDTRSGDPPLLQSPGAEMNVGPPEEKLESREDAVKIALKYPEGLKTGSFAAAGTPFSTIAYHIQDGYMKAGPDCTSGGCEYFKMLRISRLPEITSRVAAVDEESGIVWLRMDLGVGSLSGPDAGKSLISWTALKIYDGRIQGVESFTRVMPRGAPSGWDRKK